MKIKQTLKLALLSILTATAFAPALLQPVSAAKTCGGVEVAYFECDQNGQGGKVENSGLWGILTVVLNIMIAGVGIVSVGGIVYGAIMYASAQDNQSQVQQAVGIIRNTVIGLVLFAFMYAILQFLIPGGVF